MGCQNNFIDSGTSVDEHYTNPGLGLFTEDILHDYFSLSSRAMFKTSKGSSETKTSRYLI